MQKNFKTRIFANENLFYGLYHKWLLISMLDFASVLFLISRPFCLSMEYSQAKIISQVLSSFLLSVFVHFLVHECWS